MPGIFISLEGPDGSGKSSLIQVLVPKIREYFNKEVVQTREPGGSPLAEEIRQLILDTSHKEMDPKTEALLMAASRRQHLVETILPKLEAGAVVVSDRYVDSSLAYQGAGRQLGLEAVWAINHFAIQSFMPDLTLYLDIDAQAGLNRIASKNGRGVRDRLELEDIHFHNRVRQGYYTLIDHAPNRFIVIDASQELNQVADIAWQAVRERLAELGN